VLAPGGWFLGTVPYREDLNANRVICPCCGTVFHRWGHLASFSFESMRAELSPHVEVQRMRRMAYVQFRNLPPVVVAKNVVKLVLARFETTLGNPGLYFAARKQA
jgi:hypothetical protein